MRRVLRCVALVAAIGLLAAGCGDDGEESGGGGSGDAAKPVTLKIGLIPIADVAPVFLGQKKGFFKEQKITLDPQFAAGGAAITPAVDQRRLRHRLLQHRLAADRGLEEPAGPDHLPGRARRRGRLQGLGGPAGQEGRADQEPKDLEGKTIAVNTLNNICGVTINASLEKQGVDISKIKYTEIPFPEMVAALEKERVDGACVVEPFVSQGKAAGMRGIDPFYFNTAPNLTVATYFASKEYIAKNEAVVDRFVTAMKKSLEYAQAHPDEVRGVLTEYTEIPPEAAQKINLPQWESGADEGHDRGALHAEQEVRLPGGGAGPRGADPGVAASGRRRGLLGLRRRRALDQPVDVRAQVREVLQLLGRDLVARLRQPDVEDLPHLGRRRVRARRCGPTGRRTRRCRG